ncbi:hypothetical protein EXU85_29775 [Spirosoma sp. KCTC 42546]|uniref:DUF3885 domain-containing protein n=1 Tax=Spirosoma sp. KCTC 42546 TaxID=2520506 RepID=UPI001157B094|nr:hypothetical protein [Spirosoma sp. KCTC 42546]QDK82573.1 hypothetical protein EXU85_29775 [Spirosoma sp. KCTC 42546]
MTKEEFKIFWASRYPDTIPISYLFKQDYPDRWFRIHSLPKSKRYAECEDEWAILLTRHNQIITDLLGSNAKILLVTGEYNWGERATFITDEEEVFKPYHFLRLDNIDLFEFNPDDYDNYEIYRSAFAETIWNPNQHNNLLKEIAANKTGAFLISMDKNILIAPYDGGIDFVLKDGQTRDIYKQKYKEWLSEREDGL